ncbi:MAG: IS30 family transposase [Rothia sp. (in: high G+C Gram-positive bacteria)]|nr:IS30 family transposase [Rothia sp. (in: high G+C Gram-positive bacteria)]
MLPDHVNAIWDLRAAGLTGKEIAARVGSSASAVRLHFRTHGGIRPRRVKRATALSFEERIEIQALWRAKHTVRAIARELGRAPSTVSREITRNGYFPTEGSLTRRYVAMRAHAQAYERARRPKPSKLARHSQLRAFVQTELSLKRSPEQVVGRLRREFPDRPEMRVSHETIYQAIYVLSRGGLKRELEVKLRTGRTVRKPHRVVDERRGRIAGMVNIAERPAEALDRAVPGHWEGDLIIGKDGKSAIGTVVERHSNYLLLVWMDPTKNRVDALTEGLTRKMKALPGVLRRTLTWDQGREMMNHVKIAMDADIDVYFCDPRSPWQRPTNENTNGLLRQYFPKGTDLTIYSQEDLDYVEWEMNDRPRKRLEFAKPAEVIRNIVLP